MVEFELGPAIGAGLIGGGVMVVLLYTGIAMMPDAMRMNLLLLLGGMMGLTGGAAYALGLMMHAMMSGVFGVIHASIFARGDIDDAILLWGIVFGAGHAVITGMMFGMLPRVHPLIRSARMEAPGVMGLAMGMPTATGFVMLHLVFGGLVAVLYDGFI